MSKNDKLDFILFFTIVIFFGIVAIVFRVAAMEACIP